MASIARAAAGRQCRLSEACPVGDRQHRLGSRHPPGRFSARPGDPPRHVHWRTTARAGRLIVKEFAEEQQPALTIDTDLAQTLLKQLNMRGYR